MELRDGARRSKGVPGVGFGRKWLENRAESLQRRVPGPILMPFRGSLSPFRVPKFVVGDRLGPPPGVHGFEFQNLDGCHEDLIPCDKEILRGRTLSFLIQ